MKAASTLDRLRLVGAALRWRALSSTVMVIVAAAAVFAAASGPIYVHAADQSILDARLLAGAPGTGLSIIPSGAHPLRSLRRAISNVPTSPSGAAAFGKPIVSADTQVTTDSMSDGQPFSADLVSRTGVCAYLHVTSGTCPRRPDQVALSDRSARALGLQVGRQLVVIPPRSSPVRLSVAAIYRADNGQAPQWWGQNPFGFGTGTPSLPRLDDLFAAQSTVTGTMPARAISYIAQMPLLEGVLPVSTIGAFTAALAHYSAQAARNDGVSVSSGLTGAVTQSATDQHTMTTIVTVVDIQLVLLALLVLYFLAARTAETREPEVRLAGLRGFRRSGAASVALLEPVLLLCISLPVGLVSAWLVARLTSSSLYLAGVVPSLNLTALGVAVATFVAAVVATVFGARRLIGDTPRVGSTSTWSVALDAVAVAVALIAFVEVAAGGVSNGSHTDPLAAFAPGLLAFGAGVLGARLLPLVAYSTLPLTRDSRWVATGLATRRVARRPELSRQVVLTSLGLALAVFAVTGWSVATHNRSRQANFEVGADRVLTVAVQPGVDLLTAVHRADPSGRQAMAVVVENASDGTLLAVDADRLAAVGSWPAGLGGATAATVARHLVPATAPPVLLSGDALRVVAGVERTVVPAPELEATIFDDGYQTTSTLDLGALRPGEHQYTASTDGGCPDSCRLVDLAVVWTPADGQSGQTTTVPLTIRGLSSEGSDGVWRSIGAGLSAPARWRSGSGVAIDQHAAQLSVVATVDADGAPASFGPADVPAVLPAVITSDQAGGAATNGTVPGVGLDGGTINVRPVAMVPALPRVGPGASMVDLALAQRLQVGPMSDTTPEVWLAAGAPSRIVAALRAQGVSVVSVESAEDRDRTLGNDGMSLAYTAFLLSAVAAALLAVGSTVLAAVAPGRRRRAELASMLAIGLDRPVLRRWLMGEQGLVLGTGVVLGVVSGLLAALVALSSVPEFVGLGPGPPLDFSVPWAPVTITAAAIVLALGATVIIGAWGIVRQATTDDLGRED